MLKVHSIQMRIAALAGLCLVVAAGTLIAFSIYSSSSTETYVEERTRELSVDDARKILENVAATQAAAVRARLNEAFDAARTTAAAFAALDTAPAADSLEARERRQMFSDILLAILKHNPDFNGTYSAWQPEALDGQDRAFVDSRALGSDRTGRFLPYWTRGSDGSLAVQPLVEYDSEERHPNGIVKGAWYLGPQRTGRESIVGPLPYIVQGKQVYLATMSVPVIKNDTFVGVAGADYNLMFVQTLAERVSSRLFNGHSDVMLINSDGLVVAHSKYPQAIGKPLQADDPQSAALLPHFDPAATVTVEDNATDSLVALAPVTMGRTGQSWVVILRVPKAVVLEAAMALNTSLADQAAQANRTQLLVGLVVAAVGILLVWLMAGSISRPLVRVTEAVSQISDGKTNIEIAGLSRKDELGTMARATDALRGAVNEAFRLKQMVDEQPARVMLCEPENLTITYANQSAKELLRKMEPDLGCTAEEVLGRSVLKFHNRPEMIRDLLKDPRKLPYKGKFTMGRVVIENAVIPIYDQEGTYLGPMLHWEDVTKYVAMADDFQKKVQAVAEGVSQSAVQLETLSNDLQRTAETVGERSTSVASAAEQAGVNVQTVASAAEQLTASIDEISSNVSRSSDLSRQAVDRMAEARATIQSLDESVGRIGEVVNLINDVASQTNLLALNATIEAARAGDAGKGFAVVANEVKTLANQTAKATEDIARQISAVQAATKDAVRVSDQIGKAIDEVNQVTAAVAAAIEEQTAATAEISRNVHEASTGTATVSEDIGHVVSVAADAQSAARMVHDAATSLSRQASELTSEVDGFLEYMRNQ